MNDENLTSDDELFKSGSTNGFINHVNSVLQNYQRNDIASGIDEPRLHLLGERIQETNETHVKEFDDTIESLVHGLDSLTLSTDGDEYADIHQLNGFHGQVEEDFVNAVEPGQERIQRNQNVKNGSTAEFGKATDILPGVQANLKEPALPFVKPMSLNEELRSRGSDNPRSQHRTIQQEIDNRHGQRIQPSLAGCEVVAENGVSSSYASRGRPEVCSVQNLQGFNMADSNELQETTVHENGMGARSKVRDFDEKQGKGKKHSKGAKTRTLDTQVSDMPRPPFKLQQKKYDNDLVEPKQTYRVRNISPKEHRTAENLQCDETESQRFPVEHLNPFADPKGIRTIKPGGRGNSEFLPDGFKLTDGITGIGTTMAPVSPAVKPKTHVKKPNTAGIRHNSSDPQLLSTDSLAVQRGSVGTSVSAENLHANESSPVFNDLRRLDEETYSFNPPVSNQLLRLDEKALNSNSQDFNELLRLGEEATSSDIHVNDLRQQRTSVRPKENSDINKAAKLTNKTRDIAKVREKKTPPNKNKDNINMDIWRSHQEVINSAPPPTIEYINNLDSINTKDSVPTKKVQNKDMKNSNRRRNMDKTPNVSVGNIDNSDSEKVNMATPTSQNTVFPASQNTALPTGQNSVLPASQNSVLPTSPSALPYPNLNGSAIDLPAVSPHVVPDTNSSSTDRLNKSNESNTEAHPIIVPYEHERNAVQVLPSFDESLQSNVLFGDGTDMSDEMLAKMLQEKFDKEHTEMMRRNQYDVAPETLRLHNLTTDLNVADGGYRDPYVFNNDLETDSLLINRNMNDVYETSPRSVNSDQGPNEPVNVVHNMLDEETQRLYPYSIADDSIAEAEQYRQIHQLYPERSLIDRENDETSENQQSERETAPGEIYVPYSTENPREVVLPAAAGILDDGTIYVRAEQEETEGEGRSDESFARSLQRKLLMEEQEQLDEELARQLEVRQTQGGQHY